MLDVSLKKEFDQYGKNANGVHCGASVYVILLQRGTPPQSMMLTTSQDTEWHEATLALVGIDEDTLHRFLGYLIQLNEERPANDKKTNIQVYRKFLSAITFPPHLAERAKDELQAPTFIEPPKLASGARNPLRNQPSVSRQQGAP